SGDCGTPLPLSLFVVCRNLSRIQFRQDGDACFSSGVTRDGVPRFKILFAHALQLHRSEEPLLNVVPHGLLGLLEFPRSRAAAAPWPRRTWCLRPGGRSSTRAKGHLLTVERRPACSFSTRFARGMFGRRASLCGSAQNIHNVGPKKLNPLHFPKSWNPENLATNCPCLQRT